MPVDRANVRTRLIDFVDDGAASDARVRGRAPSIGRRIVSGVGLTASARRGFQRLLRQRVSTVRRSVQGRG